MPEKGKIIVLVDTVMCRRVGKWLSEWTPPEPTLLGGPNDPKVAAAIAALGIQLTKAGNRKLSTKRRGKTGKRYISIDRLHARYLANLYWPCVMMVRLWPRDVLKFRARVLGALKQRRGPKVRENRRSGWYVEGEPDQREHIYRRRARERQIEREERKAALEEARRETRQGSHWLQKILRN